MQKSKSILVVDDNKVLSGIVQRYLRQYGYEVSCCYRGLDAMKLSKEQNFDLFLVDYHMPEITGDLVCRSIRADRPDAYIVGVSCECREWDFINAGANKFIYKGELAQNLSLLNHFVQMTP